MGTDQKKNLKIQPTTCIHLGSILRIVNSTISQRNTHDNSEITKRL